MADTLAEFGCRVDVCDPWADPDEVKRHYGINSFRDPDSFDFSCCDAIVLAVAHDQFRDLDLGSRRKDGCIIYDIKGVLPRNLVDGRL